MINPAPATPQVTDILRHLEAAEQSAYEHQVDAHIEEGLGQALDPKVEKFGIHNVETSTSKIIDRHRVAPAVHA
jgi:hypothetical protein